MILDFLSKNLCVSLKHFSSKNNHEKLKKYSRFSVFYLFWRTNLIKDSQSFPTKSEIEISIVNVYLFWNILWILLLPISNFSIKFTELSGSKSEEAIFAVQIYHPSPLRWVRPMADEDEILPLRIVHRIG